MQHMAQAREEEEATQENHHSQSDEEGRWSTQSTRGSSSSRSETARSHSHDSSDIREPATRHVARRLSRMRINDEVSTRYDGDDEGAGAEQSSSLRDLKLYPLPLGMVPTRKRSFGTMLKDDSDSPQEPDKLSRELDAMMRHPYVPQHDDEIPMFTPRSVPSGSRSLVTRSSTTQEQGDTQAGSPSSRKRQESGTVYAAPSAPARAP
ncbi:hypothetical protein DL766_009781 [Monosporascus sp. MC13-8B]|uniref:Uncharacterized protein n=1 Tax=Monosporascus cannonballus TaxID=155416 RepID=A0ABY0HG27_9PEZI|nr:hypothetical protein DL762_001546 [Monosporascus cannonballus]RYO94631.1 hypothetical protein DL763_003998 [Monosporascus cannonballus]RYP13985.1 hypothetical protein DL766_009781 [Monosporascus sp. MC13-8B]